MAAKPPDAFLSYTHFDDQHDGGAISEFCRRLASAVRAVTGAHFDIFQDVEGVGIGEQWPGKLDQMLDEARFFIPIVTPSYFTIKPYREELEKFLHAEAERARNDLVLPIYYIESELLEDDDLRAADPLVSTLHERQRQDWRDLRFEPFEASNVRRALERLARQIVKARRRVISDRSKAELQQPEENEQSAAKKLRAQAERNRALPRAAMPIGMLLTPPGIAKVLTQTVPQTTSPKQTDKLLEVGTVFRDVDAPWCPELVVIPPGEFMMGSTEAEREWAVKQGVQREWVEWEKPQHLVRIAYPLGRPVPCDVRGIWPFCPHHRTHAARGRRLGPRPAAGHQRGLGGCQVLHCLALGSDRPELLPPIRGRVGVRLPGWHHDAILVGRRDHARKCELWAQRWQDQRGRELSREPLWALRHAWQRLGMGGGFLAQILRRRAGRWFCPDCRIRCRAGASRALLGPRPGEPPLGWPRREPRRRPTQRPRLPGRQDAYGATGSKSRERQSSEQAGVSRSGADRADHLKLLK